MYVHDGVVVVEQETSDQAPRKDGLGVPGGPRQGDSVFRHPDLASALAATELTEADLVDS